jgi:hypothetical protein
MSSITFKFKKELLVLMNDNYSDLKNNIAKFTADLFNKKEEEIMIDFEEYQIYEGKRDVLVRAETSRKNIDLLNIWSDGIKKIILDSKLKNLNIGIKTYVTDSYWQEFEVK